jgi:sugar/nucleoside kinase (ribokinase family)
LLTWKCTDLLLLCSLSLQEPVINISNFFQAAKSAGVPVIMDAGGMDTPLPRELLSLVDIFSPNETELARLTGMPTETFEQISMAAGKCHKMVRYLNWIFFIYNISSFVLL